MGEHSCWKAAPSSSTSTTPTRTDPSRRNRSKLLNEGCFRYPRHHWWPQDAQVRMKRGGVSATRHGEASGHQRRRFTAAVREAKILQCARVKMTLVNFHV